MRKKLVAGNWKMHGTRQSTETLLQGLVQGVNTLSKIDCVVFPSFVFLPQVEQILTESPIAWGAQNLYMGKQGAFTGEVSGPMLVDFGCRYVLIGHSERRTVFGESLETVAAKFSAALEFGLVPILCVGETLEEREEGRTEAVLARQIDSVIAATSVDPFKRVVLAYEPVWAIGTGLTASPDQAQAVHAFIRDKIAKHNVEIAATLRILYGGSVKADNAKKIFEMPDIDGGLIGGASLDVDSFLSIGKAAQSVSGG